MANPLAAVDRAEWHFLASNRSGTIGADPRVLDLLRQKGIPYTIYPPPRGAKVLANKLQAMSRAEARRHFEEYVARAEEGLERLRTAMAGSGTPLDLDCSPESMVGVWSWFLGNAEASAEPHPFDDPAALPAWVDHDQAFLQRLTPATLWIVDGLAYYLATCVQATVPGARWEMGDEPRVKHYIFQNQPLLTGFTSDISPLALVLGLVGEAVVRRDRRDPRQLSELVEAVRAEARS